MVVVSFSVLFPSFSKIDQNSMKKFLSATMLVIFASAVGWYYLPQNWREKVFASVGVALRGDKQEVKEFINGTLLPQDPEKRRAALLGELKKKLSEVKKGSTDGLTSQNFVGTVEEIVKELEAANHDVSIGREITERILGRISPSVKSGAVECRK